MKEAAHPLFASLGCFCGTKFLLTEIKAVSVSRHQQWMIMNKQRHLDKKNPFID